MKLLLSLFCAVIFSSCATVFGGKSNTLVFDETIPAEAHIYIDGADFGSPVDGKLKVPAALIQHNSSLQIIGSEGSILLEESMQRKLHMGYFVADFVAPAVSHSVDFMSGNIYRPFPRHFSIEP